MQLAFWLRIRELEFVLCVYDAERVSRCYRMPNDTVQTLVEAICALTFVLCYNVSELTKGSRGISSTSGYAIGHTVEWNMFP